MQSTSMPGPTNQSCVGSGQKTPVPLRTFFGRRFNRVPLQAALPLLRGETESRHQAAEMKKTSRPVCKQNVTLRSGMESNPAVDGGSLAPEKLQ